MSDEGIHCYTCNSMLFFVAVHGETLSFNQLHKHGGYLFPGEGVMLTQFRQPSLVPKVNLPLDFILAARGRQYSMVVNGTEGDNALTGLVNTVWNNIENYLPISVIDKEDSLR